MFVSFLNVMGSIIIEERLRDLLMVIYEIFRVFFFVLIFIYDLFSVRFWFLWIVNVYVSFKGSCCFSCIELIDVVIGGIGIYEGRFVSDGFV